MTWQDWLDIREGQDELVTVNFVLGDDPVTEVYGQSITLCTWRQINELTSTIQFDSELNRSSISQSELAALGIVIDNLTEEVTIDV